MKKFLVWLLIWGMVTGSVLEAKAMGPASSPPKPNVQHMQVMSKGTDSIAIMDIWQDIQQKHTRIDFREFMLHDGAVQSTKQKRSIILYRQGKSFEVSQSQGIEAEINRDLWDPFNIVNNKKPLLEAAVKWFEGVRWERTGSAEYNEKQLSLRKRTYTRADGQAGATIAYMNQDTGLPVKEEDFIEGNHIPETTRMYAFGEIYDPEGFLFTSEASSLLEKDMVEWLCLALDAVLPLDDALNSGMNYIAIDMSDLPGLDETGKKQVLRVFQKYKVKTMEASLDQLKEKGLYNRERAVLDGLLLRVHQIKLTDDTVLLNVSKYRGDGGAIGIDVTLEWINGKWQATHSVLQWVS